LGLKTLRAQKWRLSNDTVFVVNGMKTASIFKGAVTDMNKTVNLGG